MEAELNRNGARRMLGPQNILQIRHSVHQPRVTMLVTGCSANITVDSRPTQCACRTAMGSSEKTDFPVKALAMKFKRAGRRQQSRTVIIKHVIILLIGVIRYASARSIEQPQGPRFTREPPTEVDFSNSTGRSIDCVAKGLPPPTIEWSRPDGDKVPDVQGLRLALPNGTLYFPPFRAEDYRQDVHASVYACVATNAFGTVISRDVRVRAVVQQYYEAQVYDEFVILNNTAVMRCQIPSFVHDYVIVTSWIRENRSGVQAVIESGRRFSVFSNGVLHIREVNESDGEVMSYRCRTQHRLTGEVRLSSTAGRIIITNPQSSVPPRITHSMGLVEAIQGDAVELPCAAQGFSIPRYSWLKVKDGLFFSLSMDERLVQMGGNLLLKNIQTADSGTYVCVVNNSVGVERVETTLFVTAPLTVRIQPSVQVVDVGKPATFTCSVTGYPITSVSWLNDGRPIVVEGRIKLVSRDTLRLDPVQREDRGMYQCQARNSQMSAQGTAELKLGDAAPLLQETFSEQILNPEQSVSLRCVVSGNPPPQVTWTLDDRLLSTRDNMDVEDSVNIHGDVISNVNITRIRTEDGGEYKCRGKNRVGSTEHAARINVTGPPFIRAMANVSVVAGSVAVLVCRVTGHPIETVYWERGGAVLPVNHRQKVFSNGTLIVQNAHRALDAGVYTCVAQSSSGQSARRSVHVIVLNAPMISPFTFPHNLRVGMRAGVTCLITDGDLPINIQWLKDDHPVPAHLGISTRNIDEYTSTMVIASVSPHHSGNYTCVATNSAATVDFTSSLLVNVPPRWLMEPRDTHVIQLETARIECQADGFPSPTIKWKRAKGKSPGDYEEIPSGGRGRFASKNGTLIARQVEESDEGYYLCQANNGIGAELSKVIFLDVRVPAYFEEKHINATAKRGETGRLYCEARGDPPVGVVWKHKGMKLDSTSDLRITVKETTTAVGLRSELIISRVDRSDFTVFSCIASNPFGSDEATVKLIVQEKPEIPQRLSVTEVSSRSIRLSWRPPFDGNSPIIRFIVQYKVGEDPWSIRVMNESVSGATTDTSITGLIPATTYHIRLRAENIVGVSNASVPVTFTTDEEEPGGAPLDVQVEPIGSQQLRLTWKPPRHDLWHGQIEGYHVGFRELDLDGAYTFKTTDVKGNNNEYIISGLKKFTRYGVVMAAYNRKGTGPKSQEVATTTLEDVPSQPPQDVACTTQSSQSIVVLWNPPPPHAIHGLLQGYKVLFAPADRLQEEKDSKMTKSLRLELTGLTSFTNYTLRVVAFTNAGDGARSERIYCLTKEDVPGSPSDIKALVMSSDAILVSWLPPRNPNGVIMKYTVYIREIGIHEQGSLSHTLPPIQLYFEARGLKENFHYEFWVTASTAVGEGLKSRVVSQSPMSTVPAKIASFPERYVIPQKSDVKLLCRSVGIPTPDREWRTRGQKLQEKGRTQFASDGSLFLLGVRTADTGNYTCRVYNIYATDELTHEVIIHADHGKKGPPSAPIVKVMPTGMTSLHVTWRIEDDGGIPIEGFVLNYRRDGDMWTDVNFDGSSSNYTLSGLQCGSRYQIYMMANNRLGSSGPGEMVVINTRGFPPIAPNKESFFTLNTTFVTLHLDAWVSIDPRTCKVHSITVEYRPYDRREWTLVVRTLKVDQRVYVVGDLAPGTAYNFRVTAHSDAGAIPENYDVVTLQQGSSSDMTSRNTAKTFRFYLDMNVIIPITVATFVILVVIATMCYFARRRRYTGYKHENYPVHANQDPCEGTGFEKPSSGPHPQTYSPTSTRRMDTTNPDVLFSQGGVQDDVCPYATYQLPACITDDDNAVEFQTFRHSVGTCQQSNLPTKVIYSKVKKPRNIPVLELQKLQSQGVSYERRAPLDEKKTCSPTTPDLPMTPCDVIGMQPYSDNPLVPTAPPAEYDCSNSLYKGESYGSTPSPLPMEHSSRNKPMQRVPDLLHHRPDSSTSNEVSPNSDRQSSSRGNRYRRPRGNRRSKRLSDPVRSRCSSPESTPEDMGVSGYSRSPRASSAFCEGHQEASERQEQQQNKSADTDKKRLEATTLAAAEEELIALLKRGSVSKAASQYHPSKTDFTVRV